MNKKIRRYLKKEKSLRNKWKAEPKKYRSIKKNKNQKQSMNQSNICCVIKKKSKTNKNTETICTIMYACYNNHSEIHKTLYDPPPKKKITIVNI